MKVLRIKSEEIVNQIQSIKRKSHRLEFALDGNGDTIISTNVLNNPNFLDVHDLIKDNSEEIEYVPTE